MSDDPPVPDRQQTVRDALYFALRDASMSQHELSAAVGVRERDLAGHLQHLERSLLAQGEALHVQPAHCIACGFVFESRKRLAKPGRCPECRATRIAPPRFSIG